MVADILYIPDKTEIEKGLKQRYFLLEFLKPKKEEVVKGVKITEQDIIRAKGVPLTNFITVNRMGFARCIFHTDRTASLKVYEKTNRWWCYSCNTGTDVVDLIMKMHNKDFYSAVKFLIGK